MTGKLDAVSEPNPNREPAEQFDVSFIFPFAWEGLREMCVKFHLDGLVVPIWDGTLCGLARIIETDCSNPMLFGLVIRWEGSVSRIRVDAPYVVDLSPFIVDRFACKWKPVGGLKWFAGYQK